jgi:signal transduction histidine kinase
MRTVPVPPSGEDPVSWFGTFTDIDDQKRAEAALRQREKLESIGLLAGGIAHEFNNLLAGIMAGASFAGESIKPDHPAYEVLQIVVSSSDKAANLTRQLLAYAGKAEMLIEPVDLARTVRDSCFQASVPGNIRLIVEMADNVPLIETSGRYLQQVIDGLLGNAVEAIGAKEGSIRVRLRIAPSGAAPDTIQATSVMSGDELAPGRYVCIEVTDSGPGMDERTQEQIFDPFFTTKFTGRGLGLAAARGIVHSLGGTIRLNSAVGFGSTFSVLLPFREAAPQRSGESAAGSN